MATNFVEYEIRDGLPNGLHIQVGTNSYCQSSVYMHRSFRGSKCKGHVHTTIVWPKNDEDEGLGELHMIIITMDYGEIHWKRLKQVGKHMGKRADTEALLFLKGDVLYPV